MKQHIKIYEEFLNEDTLGSLLTMLNEAEDAVMKVKQKWEKKLQALDAKVDRHYDKGDDIALEDLEATIIPLAKKMMQAEILIAKVKEQNRPELKARLEKLKEALKQLQEKYKEEYQNYRDDAERDRMGRMGGRYGA